MFLLFVVVDAAGKFPSGLLLGNAQWIGTYGECIGTSSEKSKSQKLYNSTVLGEYCLVNIGDGTSATDLQVGDCLLNNDSFQLLILYCWFSTCCTFSLK